jgi:hypothetical protein
VLLSVDPLPLAPSCALDETGLRLQVERYRHAGKGASVVDRTSRRLVVELDQRVDASLVDATIAVERECCPFFTLDWQSVTRRLTVSVAADGHEPALDAIAFALGLGEVAGRAASD